MTSFWWTHGGHLATKTAQASLLWMVAAHVFHFAPVLAVGLALGLPAVYSGVRKLILWPGCFRYLPAWKDEAADTWAAAVLVLPLALDMIPPVCRVALGLAMAAVIWPLGLHRWALP